MLEYDVVAARQNAHGSIARCKGAEVPLDTDLNGRSDAFNPVEMLLAAIAACMIKSIERVVPLIGFSFRGVEVRLRAVRQDSPPVISLISYNLIVEFVDSAVAGGMENMDRAPYLMGSGRWGYRMGEAQIFDSMLMDGLNDAFSGRHSGWHTEDLPKSHQITREDQDRWAERSQKRFFAAQAAGHFRTEIVAVEIASRKGPTKFKGGG